MSIDMISRAKRGSKAKGTARCILFGLADAAQNDGIAWPGRGELRQWGGCSEPTVSKALATLEGLGEVVISRNRRRPNGRQTSNAYFLPLWVDPEAMQKTLKAQDDRTDILRLFVDDQGKPMFSQSGVNMGLVGRGKHGFTPINRKYQNRNEEPENGIGASTDDAPDAAYPTPPETLVKAGSANQNGTATQAEPNGVGKPKPRKSSAPRIPLGPGSLVYRDVIHLTPNHAQRELLDAAHAAHGEAAMRAVMVAWLAHGYSPKNVAGMVEAINAGGLRTNGHNGAGSRANGKPLSAMVLEI